MVIDESCLINHLHHTRYMHTWFDYVTFYL